MKKIITILSLIVITLLACEKKETTTTEHYYFKINNTTNHNIMLGLFDVEGDSLLKEYFLSPKETKILDTVVYKTNFTEKEKSSSYVSGSGYKKTINPYWHSESTKMAYMFDDTKLSKKQNTFVASCDTSSIELSDLCNYGTMDTVKKVIKKDVDFKHVITTTYIVTDAFRKDCNTPVTEKTTNIYDSKEALDKVSRDHLIKRNTPKAAKAEE